MFVLNETIHLQLLPHPLGWIDTDMSTDVASINEARRMAAMGRLGTLFPYVHRTIRAKEAQVR